MESSENPLSASAFAVIKFSAKSASLFETLIPLPPPPRAAFIITGKPTFFASFRASSTFFTLPSVPGITGIRAFCMVALASALSPSFAIVSDFGPINFIPTSVQSLANFSFSDKKPNPG